MVDLSITNTEEEFFLGLLLLDLKQVNTSRTDESAHVDHFPDL